MFVININDDEVNKSFIINKYSQKVFRYSNYDFELRSKFKAEPPFMFYPFRFLFELSCFEESEFEYLNMKEYLDIFLFWKWALT